MVKTLSLAFLADLQEDWIKNGKAIFPVLRDLMAVAVVSATRGSSVSSRKRPFARLGGLLNLRAEMARFSARSATGRSPRPWGL